MSSVDCLRQFVNERLTAAAEEIFEVFRKTINDFEKEVDRRGRLLDIAWKPELRFNRIELPQQYVCKQEKVLRVQKRSSSLDQEKPKPPQIKEEQEDLYPIQEGEQLGLKQDTVALMLTPTKEESHHSEDQTVCINLDKSSSVPERQSAVKTPVIFSVVNLGLSDRDKPYLCTTCGKRFFEKGHLKSHMRIHTGEKPFTCDICGRSFRHSGHLTVHRRGHTGEKPYLCTTCGKAFRSCGQLTVHMRIHTSTKKV